MDQLSPRFEPILTSIKDVVHSESSVHQVLSQAHIGGIKRGSEMATGEFVALLDHDDLLDPSALLKMLAY